MSCVMILLSVLAMLAYNCHLTRVMTVNPVTYMLYLLYFRSSRCRQYIDWYALGVYDTSLSQPVVPEETFLVLRTSILSSIYFFVNVLMLITSIMLLRKSTQ